MPVDASSSAIVHTLFGAALRAVDPANAVENSLSFQNDRLSGSGWSVPVRGDVFVAAVGKAAPEMIQGLEPVLGDRITGGLAITTEGHAVDKLDDRFRVYEAGHPIPDERGERATRKLLEELKRLEEDDLVVALISGGGSALLEAPVAPATLEDMAEVTRLLLEAGAPIQNLNAVRIPLSRVKGGRLRAASPAGQCVTLLLSDVLGNNPAVIASGPTVAGDATTHRALELLDQYDALARVPDRAKEVLGGESEDSSDQRYKDDVVEVVGDNDVALDAMADLAKSHGRRPYIVWRQKEGEASELARAWVDEIGLRGDTNTLMLGGGEATVTVRGDGIGGRNTEFAVAAALELERRGIRGWTVASLATDGQDALTGAAGGIVDLETPTQAREAGIDPDEALANNDTKRLLEHAGELVVTGSTGTNVNDLYFAIRDDLKL